MMNQRSFGVLLANNIIMVNLGDDGKPKPHGKTEVEFVRDRLEND